MTIERPNKGLSVWHGGGIGVALTLAALLSTWLLAGKPWIEQAAKDSQQVAVDSSRLTTLEMGVKMKADRDVTRAEHEELLQRVFRLETESMLPCKK